MSNRKLASVQIVKAINPIEGADCIELATVLDWHVVVKKNTVKVGDYVVYFEIDSILPFDKEPAFAFLDKVKGRIKTQKLRGVYSQGLIIPFDEMPESFKVKYYTPSIGWDKICMEGIDLTEELGILKYDPEAALENNFKGNKQKNSSVSSKFPEMVEKSDETRIQNCFPEFEKLKHYAETDKKFMWHYSVTEKVDGTSCTIYVGRKDLKTDIYSKVIRFIKGIFGFHELPFITKVCSRNFTVSDGLTKDETNHYNYINKKYDVVNNMMTYLNNHPELKWIALQGEILGPGIQGNKYKLTDYIWKLFNFQYETEDHKIVRHAEWSKLAVISINFGIPTVDRLQDVENMLLKCETVDDIAELAIGKSKLNNKVEREGIVVRYYPDNMSWKCISPKFLVKNNA